MKVSLATKLIVVTGVFLLFSVSSLSYIAISNRNAQKMNNVVSEAVRMSNSIKLGTHYAMMMNSRDDITHIILDLARQKDIVSIRIYNKQGQIKFSNNKDELDRVTHIKDEACYVCHSTDPPQSVLDVKKRTRLFSSGASSFIGVLTPIENEPGCSENCHFHPAEKKILGAIDVTLSMDDANRDMRLFESKMLAFTVFIFVFTSSVIFVFMLLWIIRPIKRLIHSTRLIARGEEPPVLAIDQGDEIGQLAESVVNMANAIADKQKELNRQRDEFQNLFANVPCIITVQDRNFKLLRYNREFAERFKPKRGDYCYKAYKGLDAKCPDCPVETTFRTGRSICSEESRQDADGTPSHWLVTTAPIRNAEGEIVSAMEMCLDITSSKQLERELKKSEAKLKAIFDNIPNPVFVLDAATLDILDCNQSVRAVYGYEKDELIGRPFTDMFPPGDRERYVRELLESPLIDRVPNLDKDGRRRFVTIRVSPSEFSGRKVLLVTTGDITKRLETEQHLIQAGKMATLGEMATGVAHELNQPLTVIKAAGGYFLKKLRKGETVAPDVLADLAQEIDAHVDRATKIINHLREFGRKPDMELRPVAADAVLHKALELFRQQLALREIEVTWRAQADLPPVTADPGRLEQVFVNLLINARDAIEAKSSDPKAPAGPKKIELDLQRQGETVAIRVGDSGGGIPKGVRDRIFEPFFTTKEPGKGTGLGLSISYGIIQDCGGEIRVESTGPDGTIFLISLPVAKTPGQSQDQGGRDG
jgi:histidine kinase